MKITFSSQKSNQAGSALALTMVMTGIALAILAGAMAWSANSIRLTHRSIQYTRSVAAAEAATEKVVSQITRDYLMGGEKQVEDNLSNYRRLVPTSSDSTFWNQWRFNDPNGNSDQTMVESRSSKAYVVLNSTYAGLRGFITTYTVVSDAQEATALQKVVAGVLQEIQLARIPIFQFAMYSSGDMEISCGQDFKITGRVHSNGQLYVEPDKILTFQSDVTAVNSILFQRHPLDTRTPPAGSAVYEARKDSHVAAMTLPIGTTNTPTAVREIIQPPPPGEDPNSPLGRLRYYNLADMILVVSNTGISVTSQKFNGLVTSLVTTPILVSELSGGVVTTTNSFWDAREGKTVRPIDIDVAALGNWSKTSPTLKGAIGASDKLSSLYVLDQRTLAATNLSAVRIRNGASLPTPGLTVATARPLYVLGHYNAPSLGTTNTSATRPASVIADAITILSPNWRDTNSTKTVSSRNATPTTINAAILTGVVETTAGQYSGGMENFPRFLETWGSANPLTYNGSMVKMFPSLYATNAWGKTNVYSPPARNWAYDVNFNDATKLPPLTPSLMKVFRGQWATVAPNSKVAVAADTGSGSGSSGSGSSGSGSSGSGSSGSGSSGSGS